MYQSQSSLWSIPIKQKEYVAPPTPQEAFRPSENEIYLDALAAEYQTLTETYDRTICTGQVIHGSIQPATSIELKFITQNARKTLETLQRRAMSERNLAPSQVSKAIQKYNARK